MNQDNKDRLLWGAKMLGLVAWLVLTIMTVAGVWNYNPERTIKVVAGLLGAWNVALIVIAYLNVNKGGKQPAPSEA